MNPTQTDLVHDYLKQFGSITPMAALSELGVARLAARIYDLKRAGVEIVCESVTSKKARGGTATFKKYSLAKRRDVLFDVAPDPMLMRSTRGAR